MERAQLKSIIEAFIFVSGEPVTEGALQLLLEPDGVTKSDVKEVVEELKGDYNNNEVRGLELKEVAGGFQFRTKPHLAGFIQRLDIPKAQKLSQQALDTLAIIAYKQPVIRSEIEDIRGVDSGGVLKTLLERGLIKVVGKRDEPGNPLIYATTKEFLETFDLNALKDLPTLREYAELEKERFGSGVQAPPETEQKVESFLEGIDQNPLAEKWDSEDEKIMKDVDAGLKSLRRLEREIFPKPVETLVAVPNPTNAAEGDTNAPATPAEDTLTSD